MALYAGVWKFSCDMCGQIGERPKMTVIHVADKSKVDICSHCYERCLNYPKFLSGVKEGKITVRDF